MDMDHALAWEILSRLPSSAKSSSDREAGAANEIDGLPLPFFSQREEANENVPDTATPSTTPDDDDFLFLPSFVPARPLSCGILRDRDGDGTLPALCSWEAMASEFRRVLRLRRHDPSDRGCGRATSSEMGAWLGAEEEDVDAVGNWLCGRRGRSSSSGDCWDVETETSSVVDRERVCKIYSPMKQQHEYALVDNLRDRILERINCARYWESGHSSLLSAAAAKDSSNEYVPSLDEIADQKLTATSSSINSKNIEWTPAGVSGTTMTNQQLAREMDLTCEDLVWLMEGIDSDNGEKAVTEIATQYFEKQVWSSLAGATVPTSLACSFKQEALPTVVSIVESLCHKGILHGKLSAPSTSSAAAVYAPHAYYRTQRKIADSLFETNGYLTAKKCVALGLSRSRMESFVKESFPNAVLLTNSIVDPNKLCRPLDHVIQDAILNHTFADLKSHLPEDIASDEEDMNIIISDQLLASLQEQPRVSKAFADGFTVLNRDMVFFFCEDMVNESKKMLRPLVEEWCKRRAKEITNNDKQETAKMAKHELVPLLDVAAVVGKKYADLLHLQKIHDREHKNTENVNPPTWSVEEGEDATTIYLGPLVEFCRRALFSAELQHACADSLKAEATRLDSELHGVSVSARPEGAAEMRHVGESFESSFRTLCHLLQSFARALDALSARVQRNDDEDGGADSVAVDEMKQELLRGCGSCLARLITEYCSFQHAGEIDVEGEEAGALFFENRCESPKEMRGFAAPSHFESVNVGALDFPFFALKCRPDKNGKPQDPSNCLRSAFPGSSGLSLLRMWKLCSEIDDESDDNNSDEVGKHKLEAFLCHLSQTCLNLVGIPFSVLDKKTERKVLAARREGILNRLESSQDREEVVTCAIVLIFHQVKSTPISGTKTIDLVLSRLFKEDKKIPGPVTEDLRNLKNAACNESSILIARAKKFGSAKNSKALAAVASHVME